jgi:hypothetical protein
MRHFKSALLALGLCMACTVSAHAGDFSDGWKAGWVEGYKQIKGQYFYAPYPPFPPFPPLGCNSYREGFAAGVLEGARTAEQD